MVVEDETLLLQAITKKLKLSGMDVLSCASGQQAIDYLKSLDELPDAVWLDYYLKDMNGLAFMQELKANDLWMKMPVIVVSNSASPDKVNNMLALGARKYILKAEYRLDEIIAMIREFIADNADGAPAASESAPAAGSGAAPVVASIPAPLAPAPVDDANGGVSSTGVAPEAAAGAAEPAPGTVASTESAQGAALPVESAQGALMPAEPATGTDAPADPTADQQAKNNPAV